MFLLLRQGKLYINITCFTLFLNFDFLSSAVFKMLEVVGGRNILTDLYTSIRATLAHHSRDKPDPNPTNPPMTSQPHNAILHPAFSDSYPYPFHEFCVT